MSQWEGGGPVFEDPDRFGAILSPEGAIETLNDCARTYLASSRGQYAGKRLWALPWRSTRETDRRLQAAIQAAATGSYRSVEATVTPDAESVSFEFRFRPIRDSDGAVPNVLVEGRALSERERLAEELQESEELHRVTLNNMTDTVLITNDAGEFTYVCPNVHFIFGYTAEEIHEMGHIDALFGTDLEAQVELDTTGVQTNLECTATDRSGTEHTLLVNVREVSIQGGTKLYSCRDITTRKQREVALSQLQRTSRDLLYSETYPEVATQIATDAPEILPDGHVAVYRLDDQENVLYPIAVSDSLQTALGPLPELSLEQQSSIVTAYIEESTQHHDAGTHQTGDGLTTSTGEHVAVPLGDHGVLLVAVDGDTSFDAVSHEIAELLGATTEAAFDRIARDAALRERDTALQTKNRQLTEVNRVSNLIREIDQELVHADSRETIEDAVCSRLTTDDRFAFAWIGATSASQSAIHPRAWGGTGNGYLDSIALSTTGDLETSEPAVRTVHSQAPVLIENTASELRTADWCREAVSRNFHAALTIPLMYDDVLFGVLGVYADSPNAFDEMVQDVLVELGQTIGAAINSVQRREAMQTSAVVELDYHIEESRSVLQRLADTHDCELAVGGTVQTRSGTSLLFMHLTGVDVDAVCETARGFVDVRTCDRIQADGDGGIIKLEVRGEFIASALSNHGASLRHCRVSPTAFELGIDVPRSVPPHSIDELVSNTYPSAELVAQREDHRTPDGTHAPQAPRDALTDRQREVLEVAYHSGFFGPNREVTGGDIASMLDISSTAFYDHVRRAEQKLVAGLFDSSA